MRRVKIIGYAALFALLSDCFIVCAQNAGTPASYPRDSARTNFNSNNPNATGVNPSNTNPVNNVYDKNAPANPQNNSIQPAMNSTPSVNDPTNNNLNYPHNQAAPTITPTNPNYSNGNNNSTNPSVPVQPQYNNNYNQNNNVVTPHQTASSGHIKGKRRTIASNMQQDSAKGHSYNYKSGDLHREKYGNDSSRHDTRMMRDSSRIQDRGNPNRDRGNTNHDRGNTNHDRGNPSYDRANPSHHADKDRDNMHRGTSNSTRMRHYQRNTGSGNDNNMKTLPDTSRH